MRNFEALTISGRAAETIDRWTWQLVAGEISLNALPQPLFTLYELGVAEGRAQRDDDVRQARHEADRLWLLAFGEKERRDYLFARLNRAAELADRPDVDDVLDETWRIYCASLANVREAVTL